MWELPTTLVWSGTRCGMFAFSSDVWVQVICLTRNQLACFQQSWMTSFSMQLHAKNLSTGKVRWNRIFPVNWEISRKEHLSIWSYSKAAVIQPWSYHCFFPITLLRLIWHLFTFFFISFVTPRSKILPISLRSTGNSRKSTRWVCFFFFIC